MLQGHVLSRTPLKEPLLSTFSLAVASEEAFCFPEKSIIQSTSQAAAIELQASHGPVPMLFYLLRHFCEAGVTSRRKSGEVC